MSAVLSIASPHRIKASHRRRWKGATGHSVYVLNNPLSGTDPTGYAICDDAQCSGAEGAKKGDVKKPERESASQMKFNKACGGYCQSSAKAGGNGVGGIKGNGALPQAPKQTSRENVASANRGVPMVPTSDQWQSPAPPTGVAGVMHNAGELWNDVDLERELSPLQMIVPMEGAMFPLVRGASSQGPVIVGETMIRVEQYALKVTESGYYPVMKRGFKDSVDMVWLEKDAVWKYGTTKNPFTRYTQKFLTGLGDNGVKYTTEFSGNLKQAISTQNTKIRNYLEQMGMLPPGNKIVN